MPCIGQQKEAEKPPWLGVRCDDQSCSDSISLRRKHFGLHDHRPGLKIWSLLRTRAGNLKCSGNAPSRNVFRA